MKTRFGDANRRGGDVDKTQRRDAKSPGVTAWGGSDSFRRGMEEN